MARTSQVSDQSDAIPPRPTPKSGGKKTKLKQARDAANDAGHRLLDEAETNPLGVLAAGIAVGLAVGALLPKTKLEGRYLAGLGSALNESALTAAQAAADAGKAELAAIGISKVGANEQLGRLLQGVGDAITSAAGAARESRRSARAMASGDAVTSPG